MPEWMSDPGCPPGTSTADPVVACLLLAGVDPPEPLDPLGADPLELVAETLPPEPVAEPLPPEPAVPPPAPPEWPPPDSPPPVVPAPGLCGEAFCRALSRGIE